MNNDWVGCSDCKEGKQEGRESKGKWEGVLGILTLNPPYVDIFYLFNFGVSLNKGHECDERHNMNMILRHHKCQ